MKNVFALLAFVFLVACKDTPKQVVEAPKAPVADPYLAAEHQMGFAKIGMKKAEMLKLYPNLKEDTITIEGELACWTINDTDGKVLFWAIHEESDSVSFLISDNPKMHTAEGLKVGSSYEDLKKVLPDIKISFAEGYIAHSVAKSMGFGVTGDFETKEDKEGFPQVVKVKSAKVTSLEFH